MNQKSIAPIVLFIGIFVVIGLILVGSSYFRNNNGQVLYNGTSTPEPMHFTIAVSPTPGESTCSGPDDKSCPSGYRCVQKCGPPVARAEDPTPGYQCLSNELADKPRNCPICLAENTAISTPDGAVNVKELKIGMSVWSVNAQGERVVSKIVKTSSTNAPKNHQVIHLVLMDNRELWVSPNHPTRLGSSVASLITGSTYDGSLIKKLEYISYWGDKTYDILPDSETGFYFANGIVMGSTLK